MALTWGDLNGKVQDKIIPTVADVVYKSSPVFIRIRTQNGQQFDGGVKIRQNIGYAELNGSAFGRGQTFNTDYVPTDTAFQVDPKFLTSRNSPDMQHVWRTNRVNCRELSFETICSQAARGKDFAEGSEARSVTPKNNRFHERPAVAVNVKTEEMVRAAWRHAEAQVKRLSDNNPDYVNITLYGTDDVLARGPQQAVPFVGSKIANAAGKMAKLIATDMYLDGLGTGSSTLSVDGSNGGPTAVKAAEVKFSLIKLNPETGTDCKQASRRAAVTTEREDALRGDATVCSHANGKHENTAEMTVSGVKPSNNKVNQWFDNGKKVAVVKSDYMLETPGILQYANLA